jgi:large subunit ribosomal protein L13
MPRRFQCQALDDTLFSAETSTPYGSCRRNRTRAAPKAPPETRGYCATTLIPLKFPVLSPAQHSGFPMKTISAKAETVKRDWYIVDASNKTLGRLATELARRLRGKHKPIYTPHCDTGDYLVVVNAEKIAVTGRKMDDKIYHHVTGYIGNIKSIALKDLLAQHPERVIEIAVKGMLPKNPLGRAMYSKLKVYAGPNHPHAAQQPQVLEIA